MAKKRYGEEKIKTVEDAAGRTLRPEEELHHIQEADVRVGYASRFFEMVTMTPNGTQSDPMTPKHLLFWTFCDLLEEYLRYRPCIGDHNNKEGAIVVLALLGFTEEAIVQSIETLEEEGGGCDCEILMNTARKAQHKENGPEPEQEGGGRSKEIWPNS